MARKRTNEEYIELCKEKHRNGYETPKYIYTDCHYINKRSDVEIICPIHGIFKINAHRHLNGQGCPKCGLEIAKNARRKDINEFKEEIEILFNHRYSCLSDEYTNNKTRLEFKCNICGYIFKARPNDLITHRSGCSKCKIKAQSELISYNDLINKLENRNNPIDGRFDYDFSKVENKDYYLDDSITIICKKHGEFNVKIWNFLNGKECEQCKNEKIYKLIHCDVVEFKERLDKINPNLEFNEVDFINLISPIKFKCKECNHEFYRTPTVLLNINPTCPKCNKIFSSLETEISDLLKENNISFENFKHFDWLGRLSLDFYLPKYNVAIECQGIQHFESVEYFGGEEKFIKNKERDEIKRKLCEENGVKLLYFSNLGIDYPYQVFEDKGLLLDEIRKTKIN